ncbi:MAG: sulfotransferase [Solirubrobacterales bacterium]
MDPSTNDRPAELVFVGGTGRSGTHVVASLLGEHSRFASVPIECRFHCNPNGLADLVEGRTTPEEFVDKLRRFWWHRVRVGGRGTVRLRRLAARRGGEAKVRGLHKITTRERLEEAIAEFESVAGDDPLAASRGLFFSLLGPLAAEEGKPALVEMSCFTIAAAAGLGRIFPEARFVHSVRDGRDAGSSKVSKRQKSHHPTDAASGIEWWEGRLRLAEDGVRGLDGAPERLHVVCLDELVWGDRDRTYSGLLTFLGIEDETAMRAFFDEQMSAGAAHRERWREGHPPAEQEAIAAAYEAALARIERDGFHCAQLLRRAYERPAVAGAS